MNQFTVAESPNCQIEAHRNGTFGDKTVATKEIKLEGNVQNEAKQAISACRSHFISAGAFSFAINILFLTYPIYMLQVYDRALTSGSITTLVLLTAAAVFALAVMAGLDIVRGRIFTRVGLRLDRRLHSRVIEALVESTERTGGRNQALRDLDSFRQVLSGNAVASVFDVPWIPIYLAVLFLLHPVIGVVGLAGGAVLVALALANQIVTRHPIQDGNASTIKHYADIDAALANSEVVRALGMLPHLQARWSINRESANGSQICAGDRGTLFTGITKSVRLLLQVAILGVGANLVIQEVISPGAMIAGMILVGRAIAPVDQLIANWKQFVTAAQAYRRMDALLEEFPAREERMPLPRPEGRLTVERAVFVPPGSDRPTIKGVEFEVTPGETIGVIGPNAAGKSTLARLLVGVLEPVSGSIRIDGADIYARDRAEIGQHIGYLPQDIELFAGTVRDNIARFTDGGSEAVIAAAERAGIHDMILALPDGYDTDIGLDGVMLSTGQRQRLALARALFGDPALVVLDEPNASLDGEGEAALIRTMESLKKSGTTTIVIAHRPNLLRNVDRILVLKDGAVEMYGPRDQIMAATTRGVVRPVRPVDQEMTSEIQKVEG